MSVTETKLYKTTLPIPIPGKLYRVLQRESEARLSMTGQWWVPGKDRAEPIPFGSIIMCVDSWVEQTIKSITLGYMIDYPVEKHTSLRLTFLWKEQLFESYSMNFTDWKERLAEVNLSNTP